MSAVSHWAPPGRIRSYLGNKKRNEPCVIHGPASERHITFEPFNRIQFVAFEDENAFQLDVLAGTDLMRNDYIQQPDTIHTCVFQHFNITWPLDHDMRFKLEFNSTILSNRPIIIDNLMPMC